MRGAPVETFLTHDARPHMDSELFLSALVRSSSDAIIGKTTKGCVVFWNEAAERLYGYSADEMLGQEISILIPPDRPHELADLLARISAGEVVQSYRTERVRKDGSVVAVSLTVSPVLSEDGDVIGASTIAHDLTRHEHQLAELSEIHRRAAETLSTLETLHSSAPVGLGFLDREFRLVHLNDELASFQHAAPEELIGRTIAESLPDVWRQVESVYRHVMDHDEAVLNVEVSGADASDPKHKRHWLASYYPVHLDTEIIGIGLVVIDVTEQRRAEEFHSIVMNNMAEGLLTVDAEGRMTSMNDAACQLLGWTEDELVGTTLSESILATDTGDPAVDEGNRELLDVRGAGRHVDLPDHEYRCKNGTTVSVSVSASPLFIGAEIEGAVVVFRDVTAEKAERQRVRRELDSLTWVGRVREALDEGRFVLHSQPIVPLRGGEPSEELLLRMIGRSGELIAPGAFLGVAEKYGLITDIDDWVVRRAISIAATGRHVGVNLSAESFMTLDLLCVIEHELQQTGTDPSKLVFEVTETALMRDVEKAHTFARGLIDLGCSLALDDFGTGFGTFTHVKLLDVKYLKIDIEFVRGLIGSSANQHVVRAIVNLAKGFNCETIAEGVEDEATLRLLQELGVDFAQGFHLGRPKPL